MEWGLEGTFFDVNFLKECLIRVILKRYLGSAWYEKAFKGPRRKVSPELDSRLNSDQFWLQNHFCSSKDKKVRIISVKAKIALPSCKIYYLPYELNWYHYHFFFAKIAIYLLLPCNIFNKKVILEWFLLDPGTCLSFLS